MTRLLLYLLMLLAAAGRAEELDKQRLLGMFFLDGERLLVRLTLNRDRTFELLGPDGQRLAGQFSIDGQELLLASGQIQRYLACRLQEGNLIFLPASRDRAGGADLLGGMPPTQHEEERRYLSLANWKAKGRPTELPAAQRQAEVSSKAPAGDQVPPTELSGPPLVRRLAAEIPMWVDHERILLSVRLNGAIECRAVLDTGAASCILDLSQVELKKPKLEGERKLLFPYIGQVDAHDLVLESLALGGYRLENFRVAAVARDAPLSRDAPFLLGMELLKDHPFTLDFSRRRFVLWMPGSILPDPPKGLVRVKLDLVPDPLKDGCRPFVQIPVNGVAQARFLVDTGAPLPFFLRALNPAEQGFTERWPVSRLPAFLGNSFEDLPLLEAKFKRIELGSWQLEDQTGFLLDLSSKKKRFYAGDLDALMNLIGTPFLRTLPAVHFDITNRALYLDRPADTK